MHVFIGLVFVLLETLETAAESEPSIINTNIESTTKTLNSTLSPTTAYDSTSNGNLNDGLISNESLITTFNSTNTSMRGGPGHGMPSASLKQVSNTILAICTAVGIYLCFVTVLYMCYFGKAKLKLTNSLIVVTVVMQILLCIWINIKVHTDLLTKECNLDNIMVFLFDHGSQAIIYIVLWQRQNSVSGYPYLNCLSKSRMKIFRRAVLIGILTSIFSLTIIHILLPYFAGFRGCDPVVDNSIRAAFLPALAVFFLLDTLFKIILLLMILVPILQHLAKKSSGQTAALERIVVRLCVTTVICVLTDIGFLVIAITRIPGTGVTFLPIISLLNIEITLISLICSFGDYTLRLFPMLGCIKTEEKTPSVDPCMPPNPTPTPTPNTLS